MSLFNTNKRTHEQKKNKNYLAIETAPEEEYTEKEQSKPLLENSEMRNAPTVSTSYEKRHSLRSKSIDETKGRTAEGTAVRNNVEGIELASDAVCPFGLAKNLEKQICIIPSRKKSKCPITAFIAFYFHLHSICVRVCVCALRTLVETAEEKNTYDFLMILNDFHI